MDYINQLTKTKYPIFQGGMANIATGEFAATCSNAGALGIIAAGGLDAAKLEEEIHICRKNTDKPFGVNIMLMSSHIEEIAELVAREKVPVLTTGAGNPGVYMDKWKAAGIKIIPVCASVILAKRLERIGADAIIAEGTESGGHVGEMTTMALVPQMREALDIPVIAAGGIAGGAQAAAAFALGACGIQIGTALLASEECPIHPAYKEAVLKAGDNATVVMGRIAGTPVRSVKNKMARSYLDLEKSGASKEELEQFTLGALRRAVKDGDVQEGSLMAGQVCAQLNEVRPAETIVRQIYEGAKQVMRAMGEEADRI